MNQISRGTPTRGATFEPAQGSEIIGMQKIETGLFFALISGTHRELYRLHFLAVGGSLILAPGERERAKGIENEGMGELS